MLEQLAGVIREYAPARLTRLVVRAGRRAGLPFYEQHQLLDLQLEGVDGITRAFVAQAEDRITWLDGSSAPVHDLNEAESLQLTEATVLDYVRWFLFAVRGDEGAFVLLEAHGDLIDVGAGADSLAAARSKLVPFEFMRRDEEGRFMVRASVAYAGSLFTAEFAVAPSGPIEMTDDEPQVDLDGIDAPEYPPLPDSPATRLPQRASGRGVSGSTSSPDLEVTAAVLGVLLDDAVKAQLGHPLLQRFNTQSSEAAQTPQLLRFLEESTPIVIVESEIPFAEEIVAGILDPSGETYSEVSISRAQAYPGDDSRCTIEMRSHDTRLQLISFHAYRSLWDAERTAHQLSVGRAPVVVGCRRLSDVPEPLRRVADLVLTLPRIDAALFTAIFWRLFQTPPPPAWDTDAEHGAWTRYLLHTDFHAPVRLRLPPDEAVTYLRERCVGRLRQVSAETAPALGDLYGLGEARQVAEDLIADIAAARAGTIRWSAVDRGLLLVGPPGTGKTTLARAVAREANVKFILGSAAQWQSAGALDVHLRAIRETFSEARRYAPAILFIDEIDSIGNRELLSGPNAAYQTEVINAVLEQLQGMDPEEPVMVIGATNFVERVDPALRRAGRLDQVVAIPLPNVAALVRIFEHHLESYRLEHAVGEDVEVETLAKLAFGATGADVEFFVRGAARRARKERRPITQAHLVAEVTRRPRQEGSLVRLAPEEVRRVSVHESGHALASALGRGAGADLTYISVIPRMDGSLGFVASAPPEGVTMSRRDAIARLEVALGGRAAEELVFGGDEVGLGAGGGATSDLAVATRIATALVCSSGLGGDGSLRWTEQPNKTQIEQIDGLLREAYAAVRARLALNRATLDRIAERLEADQELDGAALRAIVQSDTTNAG